MLSLLYDFCVALRVDPPELRAFPQRRVRAAGVAVAARLSGPAARGVQRLPPGLRAGGRGPDRPRPAPPRPRREV